MHRMKMSRAIGFIVGLLAFAGAHAIETMMWAAWFDDGHRAWFLNSGRAVAFTIACLFSGSFVGGWFQVSGFSIAAGALVGMVAVLFLKDDGAGTIFPIVLAAGGVLVAGVVLLGAWLGREIRQAIRSKR
jgi:hypothetical protein